MTLSSDQITYFQAKILSWYSVNKRDLPWRKSRDPYRILLSEIMLQQTQVSRVIPKYEAWLQSFPTLKNVAEAPMVEILRLWSGLGYNRRALFLQKAAKAIAVEHKGIWPQKVEELKKLSGIGEYTARAVACFAFDEQVAVVDTNVKKVIAVEFFAGVLPDDKTINSIADVLLPEGKAYDWNQALMDYASMMLRKEKIPVAKQATFVGSNRYYRGKLVKLLLTTHIVDTSEVGSLIKDDFSQQDTEWLETIISGLERDGFIKRRKRKLTLVEQSD